MKHGLLLITVSYFTVFHAVFTNFNRIKWMRLSLSIPAMFPHVQPWPRTRALTDKEWRVMRDAVVSTDNTCLVWARLTQFGRRCWSLLCSSIKIALAWSCLGLSGLVWPDLTWGVGALTVPEPKEYLRGDAFSSSSRLDFMLYKRRKWVLSAQPFSYVNW